MWSTPTSGATEVRNYYNDTTPSAACICTRSRNRILLRRERWALEEYTARRLLSDLTVRVPVRLRTTWTALSALSPSQAEFEAARAPWAHVPGAPPAVTNNQARARQPSTGPAVHHAAPRSAGICVDSAADVGTTDLGSMHMTARTRLARLRWIGMAPASHSRVHTACILLKTRPSRACCAAD